MQQKSSAIVFIGMTYPNGAIRHFALLGCELYKVCNVDFDFYFASIAREPDPGSWDIVQKEIPHDNLIKAETFEELVNRCVELAKRYEHVVIHTGGGWGQTKHFVKAQKNMGKMLATRIMLVATTHSYRNDSILRIPMSTFQYVLYRLYYRKVVFQCKYAAERFVGGNDLIRRGQGVVIPLGCEPFDDVPTQMPEGIREDPVLGRILNDTSLFKFVYLAAFRPGKMHVWLVHAIAPVLKQYPKALLLLCGGGAEKVRSSVIKAIASESLEGQVLLTGQIARDEVPWLLSSADCAIVPSRSETFGHNFLEPMFAGLPVLGTPVGIGRDIIRDGETGYIFDLVNVGRFREKVIKLLRDQELASKLGANARRLVCKAFTHSEVARKLLCTYRSIVGIGNRGVEFPATTL